MNYMSSINLKNFIIEHHLLYQLFLRFKTVADSFRQSISKRMIRRLIGLKPVIVEIGAHVGSDTAELSVVFPEGKIYSFEPIPENYNRLKYKTQTFTNVRIYQYAVGDGADGDVSQYMYICSNGCSSSLLAPKDHLTHFTDARFDEKIIVPVVQLKEFMEQNNISGIDLLWIDVQGMELRIFKSVGTELENIHYIYTEVSTREFYEGGALYSDLKKYLEEHGFRVIKSDMAEGQEMGNVLFGNTKYGKN